MSELKRAAAYVRVSTEEQSDGWSMEGQEQQIRDYAARNGYEIVQVYRDEVSGSKDKRPGFERMMLDAHSRLFSAIIVLHTSRLFRNIALSRRYKDELRNNLGWLWGHATPEEQRDITRVLLKALYVDVLEEKILMIEPMPIFKKLFTELCGDIGVTIL